AARGRCIVAIIFPGKTKKNRIHPSEGGLLMRSLTAFVGVSLTLAFTCATVWAQGTAQISGTVMDPSGARLPGAEVTATQTATGATRSVVSNETGSYVLPSLPTSP